MTPRLLRSLFEDFHRANLPFEVGDVYHRAFEDGRFDVVHAHRPGNACFSEPDSPPVEESSSGDSSIPVLAPDAVLESGGVTSTADGSTIRAEIGAVLQAEQGGLGSVWRRTVAGETPEQIRAARGADRPTSPDPLE